MRKVTAGILLLLLLPNAAWSAELWGPTTAGMTVKEVLRDVDDAYRIEDGGRLATTAVEEVRKDDVELAGESFTQQFYFMNGQLTQVTFKLDDAQDFDTNMELVDALTEDLRERFGEEVDSETTKAGIMRKANVSWIEGNRKIGIFLMSMGQDDSLLKVNYQASFGD
ncbi:hypothetical protein [Halomonas sp. HL-93]|uniref:hypothetical protein n=1 Tax=Halomonas sp. HL-93 TaxID=1666906 RepID=UPI0006D9ACEC|nr:hypothetical protein [Halomonas sp. HL-93]KPQ24517.1 MAG: hypothetical protein HLUCCO06_08995 [Halomonas sp. HL-93]SBR48383.1 hypothetical protein GA0071314_1669 [Halomonas sp. HL-93]